MARRLGWIGPAIVIVGLAIGGVAVWYWREVQPVPGEEIDRIPCAELGGDGGGTFIVRSEQGGDRSFLEEHAGSPFSGDHVVWQALIPHYAGSRGRPAIACSHGTVTVRVERSGRAEVFGFATSDGEKIGGYRLATEHEPIHVEPTGPITLTDHVRSYEIVGGPGWHQLIAVDLASGQGLWKVDLGPEPVGDGGVAEHAVWIRQGSRERAFSPQTGRESPVTRSDK
jgi:hypothetical protein